MRKMRVLLVGAAVLVLTLALAAACGGDDEGGGETPAPAETPVSAETPANGGTATEAPTATAEPIQLRTATISSLAPLYAVAREEGFFAEQGIDFSYDIVENDLPLLIAGELEFTQIAAHEVATQNNEGNDLVILTTAGGPRFNNGIACAADSPYETVQDLPEATVLGIPGLGTGTWTAFAGYATSVLEVDPTEYYDIREASPGALLGLLETGEVDCALLFFSQTLSALANPDKFKVVFQFTKAWEEETGQPLLNGQPIATSELLEKYPDLPVWVSNAFDSAVEWIGDNTQEFAAGGKYEAEAEGTGWLADEATNQIIQQSLSEGTIYSTSDIYTQGWIDAAMRFSQLLVPDLPPQEEWFVSPE